MLITATTVNGLRVIDEMKTKSPLSTDEKTIYFTRIVCLVLEDKSAVHGCTECTFTGSLGAVRLHLGAQHPKAVSTVPRVSRDQLMGLSATQLLEKAASAERNARDRDYWKRRARKAEGKLRSIHATTAPTR
ncbi:hypothetical protein [Streptomyces sp. NPDC015125]|uniref:hypothetical protein n=1 Tax=Streptomyces sp. NPDC015125 TaxID=3364938 RepID=UPI0036F5D3FF